jgi:hypothetical protein
VEEEYQCMGDDKVWIPVPKSEVSHDAKILSSKWVIKNGAFGACLNGSGFEQIPGIYFDPKSIAAPVVTMKTILFSSI